MAREEGLVFDVFDRLATEILGVVAAGLFQSVSNQYR